MTPYTHGHHQSVLTAHSHRTAQNSCAYLLPHIKPTHRILDIGCGPGTITLSLSTLIPHGHITGIDLPSAIESASGLLSSKPEVKNVSFQEGDVYNLAFEDETFDVVHAHQVLQHLSDPVRALKEMKRVLKKGGVLAARDTIYDAMCWFPQSEEMTRWRKIYSEVASHSGNPQTGSHLHYYARLASFPSSKIQKSTSTWLFTGPEDIAWFSKSWADRTLASTTATTALEKGIATQQELQRISEGWRKWGEDEDAWFSMVHGEVLCWKEE
ncbi:hypothetical protein HK097_002737 [Rhizophlyctis rosea]|uniref:Methyltransferase domain-containing protein n=1 Tax=Rhizophlyctis rosea TaxID=64517 RepID=A0AAD5SAN3_9FUNG|nr:hypothetical protein HK097_002737 [Rhizophlyctis rosea]